MDKLKILQLDRGPLNIMTGLNPYCKLISFDTVLCQGVLVFPLERGRFYLVEAMRNKEITNDGLIQILATTYSFNNLFIFFLQSIIKVFDS